MRSIWKIRSPGRRLAIVLAVGAVAVAAPVSEASAAVSPFGSFFGAGFAPVGIASWGAYGPMTGAFVMGPQNAVSNSGCGQNRPAVVGGTGSVEQIACGSVLAFIGPAIGQINTQIGPTIIGSTVLAPIVMTGGNTVTAVP
jgi:hypothetical protein